MQDFEIGQKVMVTSKMSFGTIGVISGKCREGNVYNVDTVNNVFWGEDAHKTATLNLYPEEMKRVS